MMYKINYLPIAKKDLEEIIDYITIHLNAPIAAKDFIEALDTSILRLGQFPYSCKLYKSKIENFKYEYRILQVKNYSVFYVVKENIIEIHRILYSKMDINKFL